MKALSTSILALAIAALPIVSSPATNTKTLEAKDGSVTYGASQNPTTKLAKNASATLNDSDWAKTGAGASKATVAMPDSSVITMGADSDVQMQSFSNVGGSNTARFFVVGKVRFSVEHPAGAKADYRFSTPTGQIAVRGTVGDIAATQGAGGAPGGLQVNVYALGNPTLPVQVTLVNGQVFTLAAGQSLVVTAAGGALVGAVGAVSNSSFAPFSQLGAPANASSLGITTTTTSAAAAGTTTAAAASASTAAVSTAAVAVGTAAAVTVSTQNKPTNAPPASPTPSATPSPSPQPTGTTVPITISGKPAPGSGTVPGPGIAPGPALPGAPSGGGVHTLPGGSHPIVRPSPPVN